MQATSVKSLFLFVLGILLFGLSVCPVHAGFTSLYIFGDTVSATTNNAGLFPSGTNFFGRRYINGRVWAEVLAQEQGLTNNYWYSTNRSFPVFYTNLTSLTTNWFYSSNNCSYYADDSVELVKNVAAFSAPPGTTNALFIIWVNNADFVDALPNNATNIVFWSNSINQFLTNHFKAVTNLYAKGARTLIMPNAVDISAAPAFRHYLAATNGFLRLRVIDFNAAFTTTLMNRIKTSCPNITIYVPDFFTLLDNILTNAAAYGLTNAGIDVLHDSSLTNLSMTGPGANYIWWDDEDPTAKAQAVMADVVQQLISPVQITNLTVFNGSNQLDAANLPIGLNGFVDGSTNLVLANWVAHTNFSSITTTHAVFVPASGPLWFYRLRFPYTWSWP